MSDQAKPKKAQKAKFKFKDELFGKFVSEVKGGQVRERAVDFRNYFIGGKKITAVKGQILSNEDLSYFDSAAKEYFLIKA